MMPEPADDTRFFGIDHNTDKCNQLTLRLFQGTAGFSYRNVTQLPAIPSSWSHHHLLRSDVLSENHNVT